MRSLTSLDAFFLAGDGGRATTNVSSLAVLEKCRADGSLVTRDDIIAMIGSRLHLMPPLRWRLATVPLGLGHPRWVDGEVDLDFHVRELALSSPGDERQLTRQVARLAAQRMDRSRPLWEVYLIHGLSDDRVAMLTKFHHAAVDGRSGAEIMGILLDGSPEGRELPPTPSRRPEAVPGPLSMLARGIADAPRQLGTMVLAVPNARYVDQMPTTRGIPGVRAAGRTVRRVVPRRGEDGAVLNAPGVVAPRLRFNSRVSTRRSLSLVTLNLTQVRELKEAHGATVNDVLVAVCAGALRRWLDSTGDRPDQPLVALIPVSVRPAGESGQFGNQVGAMAIPIPTDEPDPIARLTKTRDALRSAKTLHNAVPASLMRDATDLVPPLMFGRTMRTVTRLAASQSLSPVGNLIISNVLGSRSPLYCVGARLQAHYPVSAIADSLGLNITILSYLDQLNVGLLADPDLVPNLDDLAEAIAGELELLCAQSPSVRASTARR